MRVHLGSDHAGYELKAALVAYLHEHGREAVDHGATEYDPDDDYPSFCIAVGQAVVADPGSLGVVIGGSGNGEQIAANKVHGVRAALIWSEETARLSREHNDANVAGLGARMHDVDTALRLVDVFLDTPFSEGERHIRRIAEVSAFERGEHPRTGM